MALTLCSLGLFSHYTHFQSLPKEVKFKEYSFTASEKKVLLLSALLQSTEVAVVTYFFTASIALTVSLAALAVAVTCFVTIRFFISRTEFLYRAAVQNDNEKAALPYLSRIPVNESVFFSACRFGHSLLVKHILGRHANYASLNLGAFGSMLHVTIDHCHDSDRRFEVIKMITETSLKHNPNVNILAIKDLEGKTAYDLAADKVYTLITHYLWEKGDPEEHFSATRVLESFKNMDTFLYTLMYEKFQRAIQSYSPHGRQVNDINYAEVQKKLEDPKPLTLFYAGILFAKIEEDVQKEKKKNIYDEFWQAYSNREIVIFSAAKVSGQSTFLTDLKRRIEPALPFFPKKMRKAYHAFMSDLDQKLRVNWRFDLGESKAFTTDEISNLDFFFNILGHNDRLPKDKPLFEMTHHKLVKDLCKKWDSIKTTFAPTKYWFLFFESNMIKLKHEVDKIIEIKPKTKISQQSE